MTLAHAFAAFPVAVTLHVIEEWPGFPRWARRFASERYTDREYVVTHTLAIVLAVATALLFNAFPNRVILLLAFGLVFGPGVAANAIFHIGATIWSGTYCPGVVTALVVYLPLAIGTVMFVIRDGLTSPVEIGVVLVVASTVHVVEVGHTVFKRW